MCYNNKIYITYVCIYIEMKYTSLNIYIYIYISNGKKILTGIKRSYFEILIYKVILKRDWPITNATNGLIALTNHISCRRPITFVANAQFHVLPSTNYINCYLKLVLFSMQWTLIVVRINFCQVLCTLLTMLKMSSAAEWHMSAHDCIYTLQCNSYLRVKIISDTKKYIFNNNYFIKQ